MRAVWVSFIQMLAYLRRDIMLFAACLAPILAGVLFRFVLPTLEAAFIVCFHVQAVLSPYYRLIDVFFAMLSPTLLCFVSAMVVLEEADERTAGYLFVTPLRKTGYLLARFGVPAALAFLATAVLLPVFKLTVLSPMTIILFAAGGTLQGVIAALFIVTLSCNKLEGMAVAKLSALILLGAAGPFLIEDKAQAALLWLPSFWMGKAARENRALYMLPALVLSGIWIARLFRRYLRRM